LFIYLLAVVSDIYTVHQKWHWMAYLCRTAVKKNYRVLTQSTYATRAHSHPGRQRVLFGWNALYDDE